MSWRESANSNGAEYNKSRGILTIAERCIQKDKTKLYIKKKKEKTRSGVQCDVS